MRVCRLTLCIHPLRIQVGQYRLVTLLLQALGGFLIHQTATSPPPSDVLVFGADVHFAFGRLYTLRWRRRVHPVGKGDAATLEDCGRQLGGIFGGSRAVR